MEKHPEITAEMQVSVMTALYPRTSVVLLRMGVQCVGCWISRFHTVADVAVEWNLDLDRLLEELNRIALEDAPMTEEAP